VSGGELDFLRADFLKEVSALIEQAEAKLLALERLPDTDVQDLAPWHAILGHLHTIKGSCGVMGYRDAEALAHAMETQARAAQEAAPTRRRAMLAALIDALDALGAAVREPATQEVVARHALEGLHSTLQGEGAGVPVQRGDAPAPGPSRAPPAPYRPIGEAGEPIGEVRVAAEKLDRLLELVGELTTHRGRVATSVHGLLDRLPARDEAATAILDVLDDLTKTIDECRLRVVEARMLPLSNTVARFRRVVRDLCVSTGKSVALEVEGATTVADKTIVDAVNEPLLHIVRNAVDHGIELPAERTAAGKPPEGRIELRIEQRQGEVVFHVRDDGRGIDRKKLAQRAQERGISTVGWSDEELLDLVFLPEISTATDVTLVSGRGVGLEAARRAIERTGGTLRATSTLGAGTVFTFNLPNTLSIQRTLLVVCGPEVYAIALTAVLGSIRVSATELRRVAGGSFLRWRGRMIPAVDLASWLAVPAERRERPSFCVVVQHGHRCCGLLVDEVVGQQEVVLKQLDPVLDRPTGVAGAAVLGDGRVVIVLDVRAIATLHPTTSDDPPALAEVGT
jgi:two-component system chemotaxis sensor kinase CheA